MNKNRELSKEGIRFYPDGTCEVLGHPKDLWAVVRQLQPPASKKQGALELWGDLSAGRQQEKSKNYDNHEDEMSE